MTQACISPPELDEKLLLMYLNGEADGETILHLQRCDYCRERAEDLDSFQKRLTSHIYRATCPSAMELGEYHLDLLPDPQRLVIAQHLRQCPHCARELAELRDFLDEGPPLSLMGSMKILIARLIGKEQGDQTSDLSFVPALEGLRGEGEGPLIYQANDVQIVIDIQNDTNQPDRKVILGLLTGAESKLFSVHLRSRDGEVVATVAIDEIGNFIIPHLVSGQYELRFSGPDIEIRIPALAV